MKSEINSGLLAIAICACTFIPITCLQAGEADNETEQDVERIVALAPTASAPTNAVGIAKLESDHAQAGTNRIEIRAFGLLPGTYTVAVFDRSGSNSAVLGTLSDAGASEGDDNSGDDSSADDASGGDASGIEDGGHHQRHGGGGGGSGHSEDNGGIEASFPLPDSISAFDLGHVSITDESGVEMLAGDFSDVSMTVGGAVSVRVPATGGAGDADASGVASIHGRMRRGRGTGTFQLTAANLPPRTTLSLVVNGEDAGTARTDRHGRLRIRKTHRTLDVFAVSTVSVQDDSGNEMLKAQF